MCLKLGLCLNSLLNQHLRLLHQAPYWGQGTTMPSNLAYFKMELNKFLNGVIWLGCLPKQEIGLDGPGGAF